MKLNFFAGVEYQSRIYFSDFNSLNGLFSLDIENHAIRFLKLFEKEKLIPRLHRTAFLYKNEAWFIPQRAEYIANVNMETLEIKYYKTPFCNINIYAEDLCKYITGHIFGGKYLCLIPYDIDTALIINMETHEMYPFFGAINKEETITDGVVIKDNLYLFPMKGKFVIKINLKTKKKEKLEWDFKEGAFGTAQIYDEKLWFSPVSEKYILCVDIITGEKRKIMIPQLNDEYRGMLQTIDKIIVLPYQAKNFLVIDKRTYDTNLYLPEEKENFWISPNNVSPVASKEKKIIGMGLAEYILLWDREITVISLELSTKKLYEQIYEYLKLNRNLDKFLESVNIDDLLKLIGLDMSTIYREAENLVRTDIVLRIITYKKRCEDTIRTAAMGKQIWKRIREE